MMTTLIPITSGHARIAGHDVAKDADAVPGDWSDSAGADQRSGSTVEENLNIYAKLYNVPAKERKRSIEELLGLVDPSEMAGAQTKTLSGGMRRRLEIARAGASP